MSPQVANWATFSAAQSLMPAKVAVMVAVPSATPAARPPATMVTNQAVDGAIVIGSSTTGAETLRVAEPSIPSRLAVMVAVPAVTPVASLRRRWWQPARCCWTK